MKFWGMTHGDAEDRTQYWEAMHPALIRVFYFIAWVIITLFGILIIIDWFMANDNFGLLLLPKAALLITLIAATLSLRTAWGKSHAELLGVTGVYVILFTAVYTASILQEQIVPFAALFGVLASATMIPWHPRYHTLAVIGAILAVFGNQYVLNQSLFTFTNEVVSSIILSLASIPLAIYRAEQSFALWQALDAVREGEERFRQLGENSRDIIWIWSLNRTIQYISPAYEHFTGFSPAILHTHPFHIMDMIYPEDRDNFDNMLDDIMAGHFRKMDVRIRHRDGGMFWLEGWGAPIYDQSGNISHCIGTWHDITERVELVNELNAYAHTVAHDLKAPLSVITGFSAILEEDLEGKISDKEHETVETIARTAHKMVSIIDELLILASVRDMTKVSVTQLNMAPIVQHVMDRFVKQIDEKCAEVVLPDDWVASLGYAPWIEEVWANYISNALKYGGTPPRIELGSTALPDRNCVRYWVKDNGKGLTANQINEVFEQFSRLDPERADGHGIGLSIVKRIIEKLHGDVGVESESGSGSTFYFELPAMIPSKKETTL